MWRLAVHIYDSLDDSPQYAVGNYANVFPFWALEQGYHDKNRKALEHVHFLEFKDRFQATSCFML